MEYKLYGIANCDTVRKAKNFLKNIDVAFEFVDFKKISPQIEWLKRWELFFGELPANKKGPTFRKIKEAYDIGSKSEKMALLIANSSAIKRPILEKEGTVLAIGFDEEIYRKIK